MNAFNLNWQDAIVIGSAGLALLAVATVTMSLLALRRLRARTAAIEAGGAALRREFEAAAAVVARTDRRLERIEREHAGFADRVRFVELRAGSRSFDQAIDSARRGADPTKLANQFGLSNGEADLVSRLHRQRN